MKTILCLIGTRPEAIKMASVVRELKSRPGVKVVVCVTGQHREMLEPILSFFQIEPQIDLGLMRPDQTLSGLTARLIEGLDEVIRRISPDWVVAQGDTTSVMAAAMAAFYRNVPFAHVEAGLRTGDLAAPFPEEFHRRVADMVALLHFAPTPQASARLKSEGIPPSQIIMTGNTVVDALLEACKADPDWSKGPLLQVNRSKPIVVVTAHRRENFGQPMREICESVAELAHKFASRQIQWVFPVHLNPNVKKTVFEILDHVPNVILLDPLEYPWHVQLMKHARLILTDSGGIQEEAPTLGVTVLVLRSTTERPEGLATGQAKLIGWKRQDIVREASQELQSALTQPTPGISHVNPYGDGFAGRRIADALLGDHPD
ncbi:MAG: UDP-N-acetylglucosamine 2-epimerase (non-hydrolyzing) [Planctomycetota bacterium]|nr:MAG: UDP-N-acetylglucosamine 2-epimerase (non-hydrolyzing) [Planctomycetota bacterium]